MNEDLARNEYLEKMNKSHEDAEVFLSGLILNPNFPFLGASPDGILSCNCCPQRLLEIKCPFKYRFQSPTSEDALSDKAYCLRTDENNKISLDCHHSYYTQIQGHLLISGFDICDFVCWTTKGLFIETIHKDKLHLAAVLPKLRKMFSKYILPELLTHHLKEKIHDTMEAEYCYCRKGEEGRMIACDNVNCIIEWFHFSCVGIKQKPKGKWYCTECKEHIT